MSGGAMGPDLGMLSSVQHAGKMSAGGGGGGSNTLDVGVSEDLSQSVAGNLDGSVMASILTGGFSTVFNASLFKDVELWSGLKISLPTVPLAKSIIGEGKQK